MESPLVRLMSKVRKTDTCWLWTGSVSDFGYGWFYMNGLTLNAHRAMWILTKGDPGSLCVLHTCDIPACVNPDHLFLGTKNDNNQDKIRKGRHIAASGSNHGMSKLTKEQVSTIKFLLSIGITHGRIAKQFGVGRTCITEIARGKNWK